jgi:hypothetical protein
MPGAGPASTPLVVAEDVDAGDKHGHDVRSRQATSAIVTAPLKWHAA